MCAEKDTSVRSCLCKCTIHVYKHVCFYVIIDKSLKSSIIENMNWLALHSAHTPGTWRMPGNDCRIDGFLTGYQLMWEIYEQLDLHAAFHQKEVLPAPGSRMSYYCRKGVAVYAQLFTSL